MKMIKKYWFSLRFFFKYSNFTCIKFSVTNLDVLFYTYLFYVKFFLFIYFPYFLEYKLTRKKRFGVQVTFYYYIEK